MAKLELLSPAGDMERLEMAVLYGADAVYLAGTSFGMRSFAGNFDDEELPKAVRFAHDHGVKVHATVNTMPRNNEVAALPAHLEKLQAAGVDALILADLGAFTQADQQSGERGKAQREVRQGMEDPDRRIKQQPGPFGPGWNYVRGSCRGSAGLRPAPHRRSGTWAAALPGGDTGDRLRYGRGGCVRCRSGCPVRSPG